MEQWWRLRSFWEPFWRLLLWGETKRKGVIKVIALASSLSVPSLASFWESPSSYVFLSILHREVVSTPIRFGVLISISLGFLWLVFTIGRAYELSGVANLTVDTALIRDGKRYRLFLESNRKDLDTKVRLMEILDASCKPLVPGRFPLELEWTHHPGQSSIHLTADVRESVSVVAIDYDDAGRPSLLLTGAQHSAAIALGTFKEAYLQVLIEYPKHRPIERWFCVEAVTDRKVCVSTAVNPRGPGGSALPH